MSSSHRRLAKDSLDSDRPVHQKDIKRYARSSSVLVFFKNSNDLIFFFLQRKLWKEIENEELKRENVCEKRARMEEKSKESQEEKALMGGWI